MNSRYDIMSTSVTSDPLDNQVYPDTLSVNFDQFTYSQPPFIVQPNDQLASKPYLYTYAYYNVAAYDDIIFNINAVPHVSLLSEFTQIDFPTLSDLNTFLKMFTKV